MPQKKSIEPAQDATECVLRIGKNNNVVQWKEEMQTTVTALYGLTSMFFTTNERYVQPFPRVEDYIPDFPESDDEVEEEGEGLDAEGEPLSAADLAARKRKAYPKASGRRIRGAAKSDGFPKIERTYGMTAYVEAHVTRVAEQSERKRL
jgi:hypothetical protein